MSFSQDVLKLVKKVPKGRVTIYKALAHKLNTKAYRAVGSALNRNKNPIKIPCHRVINSDGSIGGYSKGTRIKIQLLKSEGIEIKNNKINLKKYLHKS